MNIKLRINSKMLIYVLGTTILVYVTAFSFIALKLRTNSYTNAVQALDAQTDEVSTIVQKKLNNYTDAVQVLSATFSNTEVINDEPGHKAIALMMRSMLENNPDFISIWTIWEPDAFYKKNTTGIDGETQEFLELALQKQTDSIILLKKRDQSIAKLEHNKLYAEVKNSIQLTITEPHTVVNPQNTTDTLLQAGFVMPIINNGRFIGAVGINASLNYLQSEFSTNRIMHAGSVLIITHAGNFLAHPNSNYLGKSFEEYAPVIQTVHSVKENIQKLEMLSFEAVEPISNAECHFSFIPVTLGNSKTPWSFCTLVPLKTIYAEADKTFRFALLVGLIGFIIISTVIFIIAKSLTGSLVLATGSLHEISQGNIYKVNKLKFVFNDEINDMARAMNKLVEGLSGAAQFAAQIGKGQLDADYALLSDDDVLGTSLKKMQKSLRIAKDAEETKQIEDEKRNWSTHGLAKFSEIIRQHNDDMDRFTLNLAKNIAEYMKAAQVAIYINQQIEHENSDEDLFELKAALAYGKQVLISKTFFSGQELLGRAVEENKTIVMENLPEHYVQLSPGMQSKQRPNNLIIVPLPVNETVYGVLEILTYEKLESYEIDFLKRLAENTASVISSVKTTLRTEKLLQQSQHQADELSQHEEEMRQNLEEMQATQEEANKRQNELMAHIKAIKGSVMMAELDIQGRILDISPAMSVVYGASIENMRGKYYESFISQEKEKQEEFTKFWDELVENGRGKRMQNFTHRSKVAWILESFLVLHTESQLPRVLVVAIDKTRERELNDKLNEEIKAQVSK